jgi:hypothetical protein
MVYDVGGGKGDGHSHVLKLIERSFEVQFLMSPPAKHAPGMLMELFQRSLEDTMLVVCVVSSKG